MCSDLVDVMEKNKTQVRVAILCLIRRLQGVVVINTVCDTFVLLVRLNQRNTLHVRHLNQATD